LRIDDISWAQTYAKYINTTLAEKEIFLEAVLNLLNNNSITPALRLFSVLSSSFTRQIACYLPPKTER
jgi:hypothetical protein